jgi:hypothetical protein
MPVEVHKYNVDESISDLFRYFGGSLELVSLDGWGEIVRYQIYMYHADTIALQGTDVYLRLPKLVSCGVLCHLRTLLMRPKGTNLEGIEV